jgi:GxxExxY protein
MRGPSRYSWKRLDYESRDSIQYQVYFKETEIGFFRADLLINGRLIVEIKRARQLHPRHRAQLINVLKASTVEVGLLLNFGPKPVFKRIIFTNDRKQCPKASQLRNSDKFTR